MRRVHLCACALALSACGGGSGETAEPEPEAERSSGNERVEPNDGVEVEGLMGSISEMSVQRALEPKMGRFLRCFTSRLDDVEVLAGHFEMAFRIARDGTVRWVYGRASTIGDRETERCLLDTASRVRFTRPSGGEAEFAYPLDLDLVEDVRPPTFWDSSRVADAVESLGPDVRSSCGGGGNVTVYVSPGGEVLAAGVVVDDPESQDHLDCVSEAVAGWTLPDPGSYAAKVSFDI
ncbi:MAG: AgmX/PglI C-terminal domain-containing protein [Myxococcota bacterium]